MDSLIERLRISDRTREQLAPWIPSLLLGLAAIHFVINRNSYSFMDSIDLVIHEAGHVFFAFFGEYIRMAGGTLMQILLPAGLAYYFYTNGYKFGYQLMMFWFGQSLLNVSVYAADARAQVLPLLGGSRVTHDWHYMLERTGMLEYDQMIAGFYVVLSILVFILMVTAPRYMM